MKSGKILPLLLSVLSLLIIDGAKAQTVSNVSLVAKGAFELDGNYPKGRDGKALLNLLPGFLKPENGQKINYFVLGMSDEMVKFQSSISTNAYADINPCSGAVDRSLSDIAQPFGGFLEPVVGRNDLLPYLKRSSVIKSGNYLYIALDSNLRSYSKGTNEYGYEWLPPAVQSKQVCLTISVGRMGHGAFLSQPINISKLAEFVFLDSE